MEICEDDSCEVGVGTFLNEAVDPWILRMHSATLTSILRIDLWEFKKRRTTRNIRNQCWRTLDNHCLSNKGKMWLSSEKESDVFAKSEFDLGRTGLVKHVIDDRRGINHSNNNYAGILWLICQWSMNMSTKCCKMASLNHHQVQGFKCGTSS